MEEFAACWEGLDDPRTGNAALHDFNEMLVISLCCVLSGGQGAVDMGLYAKAKEPFLRGFLKLSNGLPSHDTFSRLFRRLDPEQFRAAFQRFMAKFSGHCQGVVAIDGKVLRRSFDRTSSKSALHMVSAWGCEQRLAAQIATDAKSNEITAVPKLLEMLSLKGTIVTTDALNCQRAIAQQIVDQGGDYALALKGNQGTLHDDVKLFLDDPACEATTAEPTVEADHGRIETRTAMVSDRYRVVAEAPSMAWPCRHRQGGPHPRSDRQDLDRDGLLSAEQGALRRALQRRGTTTLGRREPAALAARRRHERLQDRIAEQLACTKALPRLVRSFFKAQVSPILPTGECTRAASCV